MSEIILSLSSNSVDKAIDEYTDPSSFSGSSDSNNSDSGNGSGRTSIRLVFLGFL